MIVAELTRTVIKPLALLISAGVLLIGCAVNSSYVGESTAETKRNILASPLFLTSDVFYPKGLSADINQLPEQLSPKHVTTLQAHFERLLSQLVQRHNDRRYILQDYLDVPLAELRNHNVVLPNTGQPLLHIEANGDLVIDLQVVQALFLSTLVSGMADEYVGVRDFFFTDPYDFSQLPEIQNQRPVADSLTEFLEFKHMVENTTAYPMVLDDIVFFVDGLFVDSTKDWTTSKWSDYASITAETEERYIGTLLFLFAHEIGHWSLGHFAKSSGLEQEAEFQELELAADRYAAALLADAFDEKDLFGDQERVTLNMRGDELFFQLSENLVGFKEGPTRGGWHYPSTEMRLNATRQIYDVVILARRAELGYRLEKSWLFGNYWTKDKKEGDEAK